METTHDGRRERSEATRASLLEAAAKLFAERGFEGATLDDLAREAKVHRALVRYHFGGKQGLYSAVLTDAIEAGVALLEPVREQAGSAAERLGAFVDALGLLFERRPHFAPMIVREWMSGGAYMEEQVFASFLSFFQVDREILEQGRASGEFADLDPHAAHLALVGSLVFFQVSQPVRERRGRDVPVPPLERSTYLELVKGIFRRGLAR